MYLSRIFKLVLAHNYGEGFGDATLRHLGARCACVHTPSYGTRNLGQARLPFDRPATMVNPFLDGPRLDQVTAGFALLAAGALTAFRVSNSMRRGRAAVGSRS